ncbi:MAG TPA: hypothetical protein DCZ95_12150 [Verrucomicrobia bacterium]|nr:MAG: hypothetical protein A2X46_14200 [Lentisphaerae bacterium GWF2_57_35]HBA84837.1 hypothetical protein [Verrucomicrobiota bacterium]
MMRRLLKRNTPTAALLLLAIVLTGCSTTRNTHLYPGPARPPQEIARIACESGGEPFTVITAVDGRPIRSRFLAGQPVLCVLPGAHRLAFYWKCYDTVHANNLSFRDADGQLSFVAQAGNLYTLRSRDAGERVHFWIEDQKGRDVSLREDLLDAKPN